VSIFYQAKDFIQTAQGLLFAVVAEAEQDALIPCYLRYVSNNGVWRKVASAEATQILHSHYPQFLYHSAKMDAHLHGVQPHEVLHHYTPRQRLQSLLDQPASDAVIADFQQLCHALILDGNVLEQLGVTGSLLPGLQNPNSDIDLVCYDRTVFHSLRERVKYLIASQQFQALSADDWLASYQRRDCALSLDEYVWHEQRKFNKAIINQRKFDLSLVAPTRELADKTYHKLGVVQLGTQVLDASYGFDYPAEFKLADVVIKSVVSYTATYTGQALAGEQVLIAGWLEADELGNQRIVVGSNREAQGEYIKVIRD
jgi:predicted nucleotidyltransferase